MDSFARGALFAGRYEIVRQIGAGGMGTVHEVRDKTTGRKRALKVMKAAMARKDALRKRFVREATVAADIESAHIAETMDAGHDDATGALYIVFELLKGQPLDELVKQSGAVPPEDVLRYISQAAMALDRAHAANVVHRDLKPDNLFVTYLDDGSPHIKLLDFGIAKIIRETMSPAETKGLLGTPLYMAPEQLSAAHPVTPATDIYALTQLTYTLLVGQPYWAPEHESASSFYIALTVMMKGPVECATRRASTRGVRLPPAFDAWFARGTAVDPAERFADALECSEQLRLALDEPATNDEPQEPSVVLPVRTMWPFALGAMALLVAVVVGVFFAMGAGP